MAVVVSFGALITSDPLLKFTNFLEKYLRTPTYNNSQYSVYNVIVY